ncbi:MAG: type II toxin-antitoxin system RelE/ParE family toxin [Candidatus Nanoarchaeia archaeon]
MTKITFSQEAKEVYDFLEVQSKVSKKERIILKSLKSKLEEIQKNPHKGDPIKKKLIPTYYKIKYSAINLFRVELAQYWRMIYTLTRNEDEIEIIAFIIDISDHEVYNKKFGYKNK